MRRRQEVTRGQNRHCKVEWDRRMGREQENRDPEERKCERMELQRSGKAGHRLQNSGKDGRSRVKEGRYDGEEKVW